MAEEEKEEAPEKEEEQSEEEAAPDLIKNAEKAAKILKEENDRTEKLVREMREIETRKILGGKSEAGAGPEKKEEISDEEFAKKLQRGEVPMDDLLSKKRK